MSAGTGGSKVLGFLDILIKLLATGALVGILVILYMLNENLSKFNKGQDSLRVSMVLGSKLVFVSGVDFEHILYGSTGVTSCPLFEILNSDWDIERRVGDNTTPLYHAYAIQCGGDETLALCKDEILRDLDLPKNELFPQELRQAKRMMDDGEKICTQIATEGPKEGAVKEEWNELVRHRDNALAELPQILHKAFGHGDDFFFVNGRLRFSLRMLMGNSHGFPPPGRLPTDYWYAMDTSELRAELSALLPLAERLDRQQQIMDSA
ncbi:hypothetical protein F5X68DRAFT_266318 [Plectosphaerella plurivora]|uniref:Uncharacterized protein n=1 Tax=Plectosphaerella plurivora TaxID=936078 RepID=A0A9P8V111_9PEZI|nr:hypothetical protein F5X68DRAFT_266318 [Plectosphaerella plurivora]